MTQICYLELVELLLELVHIAAGDRYHLRESFIGSEKPGERRLQRFCEAGKVEGHGAAEETRLRASRRNQAATAL